MSRPAGRLLTLFFSTFKISAFTFGGGFVIVPLMRKRFVEELGWLDDQEMLDLTAIAQSAPGPIAVNASILVGYRTAGVPGALVTVLGAVLPPLIILTILSFLYDRIRENRFVDMALTGMMAGVAAVLCDVVISLVQGIAKQRRWFPLLILTGAFLAIRVLHINIMLVLAVCGLIGALEARARTAGKGDAA